MPSELNTDVLYFGLKLYEVLTLIGITLGPIIAVIITLVTERRRRIREGQIQVMRMLLNTRHLPGDPTWSVAINLVPVEFNKSQKIMAAWKDYIDTVRYTPTTDNQDSHNKLMMAKQTTLIYRIMKYLGFELSETDIQTSAYAAGGFIQRDNLYLDSLMAMREIAETMKQQNKLFQDSRNETD